MPHALIVDDDKNFSLALAEFIQQEGFTTAWAQTLEEARSKIHEAPLDLLLMDLVLPDGDGLELIQTLDPTLTTRIIVITAHPSIDTAVESLRARVFDFLIKPVDIERLKISIRTLAAQIIASKTASPVQGESALFYELVGTSPAMQKLFDMLEKVAPTDATVFLQGESGTGKELVARAIHQLSLRRDHRFLAVNCGAISTNLIGSELFGHERGSFTGANRQHKGHFERASGGTLFLDEVTEMPVDLQVQFLRVLETGTLLRLGGDQEIPVDVRVIAATNRNPEEAIAAGQLRKDLYFRLMVFPINIPPLRERNGDIRLLVHHFLAELNQRHGTDKRLTETAIEYLEEQTWPGNVRELRNVMQRAFILADTLIDTIHLGQLEEIEEENQASPLHFSVGTSIEDAERRLIFATLEHYVGDKSRTAEALGISLKTLYNRLKQYEGE